MLDTTPGPNRRKNVRANASPNWSRYPHVPDVVHAARYGSAA
jgi:hypothetical protein